MKIVLYGGTMSTSRTVIIASGGSKADGSVQSWSSCKREKETTAGQTELELQESRNPPTPRIELCAPHFHTPSTPTLPQIQVRTADICPQVQGFLTRSVFGPTPRDNKTPSSSLFFVYGQAKLWHIYSRSKTLSFKNICRYRPFTFSK